RDPKDPSVRSKILALLPELEGKGEGKIDNAEVTIFDLSNKKPTVWVKWGFSGGYDKVDDRELNDKIMVNFFVVTQPFKYSDPPDQDSTNIYYPGNLLKFKTELNNGFINFDKGTEGTVKFGREQVDLKDLKEVTSARIAERAYLLSINPLTEKDWSFFQ